MAGRPMPTSISTKRSRIATLARQMPEAAIRSLSHHIDLDWMAEAYRRTRKDGAVGVDGQTAEDFASDLEANLQSLLDRAKSGAYRAPPVRRVDIPKGGGQTRPIGVPTFKDKVLQRAVHMVLEPLYEQDFYDCSYGFRPGRSAHDALDAVREAAHVLGGGWVLDADVSSFFDTIDHQQLQDLLRRRVADGVVVRLIGKWLNAGVMVDDRVTRPDVGTPQGGVISPLLANIYLHEVLDRWWFEEVVPQLRGRASLIRYADDFLLLFERRDDAERVHRVLPRRLGRFGLTLHPEKTRLVPFRRPKGGGGPKPGTFDFVGFTVHWGRSRAGGHVVKTRTASSRLNRAITAAYAWMKRHMHDPIPYQAAALGRALRGHDEYYGRPGNFQQLEKLRPAIERRWRQVLARRSQRGMPWHRFAWVLRRFPLPKPRIRRKGRTQLRLANA